MPERGKIQDVYLHPNRNAKDISCLLYTSGAGYVAFGHYLRVCVGIEHGGVQFEPYPPVGRRQQAAGGTADVCGACGTNYAAAWHHKAEEAYEVSVSEWSDYNQLNKMKYIIIGLGNYGHVLAEELSALGLSLIHI